MRQFLGYRRKLIGRTKTPLLARPWSDEFDDFQIDIAIQITFPAPLPTCHHISQGLDDHMVHVKCARKSLATGKTVSPLNRAQITVDDEAWTGVADGIEV